MSIRMGDFECNEQGHQVVTGNGHLEQSFKLILF